MPSGKLCCRRPKLTSTARADFKCHSMTRRELWEMIGREELRGGGGGGVGEDVNGIKKNIVF